jgi:hypothetical protein
MIVEEISAVGAPAPYYQCISCDTKFESLTKLPFFVFFNVEDIVRYIYNCKISISLTFHRQSRIVEDYSPSTTSQKPCQPA